jgi:hypothetical protein
LLPSLAKLHSSSLFFLHLLLPQLDALQSLESSKVRGECRRISLSVDCGSLGCTRSSAANSLIQNEHEAFLVGRNGLIRGKLCHGALPALGRRRLAFMPRIPQGIHDPAHVGVAFRWLQVELRCSERHHCRFEIVG